jgi:hypothetical protein
MKTKIEKQKSVPKKARRKTRWVRYAKEMVSGDSVLVANRNEADGLRMALKKRGKGGRGNVIYRTCEEGVRVWLK